MWLQKQLAAKLQSDADQSVPLRKAKAAIKREIRDPSNCQQVNITLVSNWKVRKKKPRPEEKEQNWPSLGEDTIESWATTKKDIQDLASASILT